LEIDRSSPTTVYAQIAGDLRRQILEGVLPPFARIETEAALMKRHGVSRATVGQALTILQREGLIVRRRAKGTFVAGPLVRHDLTRLSGFYDSFAAHGLPFETTLRNFAMVETDDRVRARLGRTNAMYLERAYVMNGVAVAITCIHMIPEARVVSHAQAEDLPCYRILRERLGRTIARAEIAIRAERADPAIATTLAIDSHGPVLVLDRVSFDEHDAPLEASLVFVRPEAYEFTLAVSDGINVAGALRMKDAR
jgi:GntR family transcriptional regulator